MQRVFALKTTVLLQLQTPGRVGLVLLRRIITLLALSASQCYPLSSHLTPNSRGQPRPVSSTERGSHVIIRFLFLLVDLCNRSGSDSPATFTDSKAHFLFHSNRLNQLDAHADIVARHNHLYPFR